MILPSNLRGIVHGKTIELNDDPGLKEGQEVELTLRLPIETAASGAGLKRSAGALADSWQAEDDAILDAIHENRKRSTGRDLPL